jgi:hypothetical protein
MNTNTVRLRIFVGWVEERWRSLCYATLPRTRRVTQHLVGFVGFHFVQPNLHIFIFSLNRTVLDAIQLLLELFLRQNKRFVQFVVGHKVYLQVTLHHRK